MANPYADGGIATAGGGNGNWDDTSAVINDYAAPQVNCFNLAFVRSYIVEDAKLLILSYDIWDFWKGLKNYFTKADEAIIGIIKIPINISDIPRTSSEIVLGATETGIAGWQPTTQFLTIDFGTCEIDKYSDSFLDYNNNTQVSLYLPYIGSVDLDTDVVMGTTLNVKYVVDLLTGNLEAQVYVDGSLTYTYQSNCAYQVPTTSINYAQTLESTVRTAATTITSLASILASL